MSIEATPRYILLDALCVIISNKGYFVTMGVGLLRSHTLRKKGPGFVVLHTGTLTLSACSSLRDREGHVSGGAESDGTGVPGPCLVLKQVLARQAVLCGVTLFKRHELSNAELLYCAMWSACLGYVREPTG